MKMNSIIFVVGFVLAFGVGYLFFDSGSPADTTDSASTAEEASTETEAEATEESADTDEAADANEEGASEETEAISQVPDEAEALSRNGCLSCHAVESIGAEGGTTGPDLSQAYNEVEGKHGKSLDKFLQEPTSAVMSTVVADNPLEEEEREQILEALKQAAEN
ncbi:cytochrome C [Oceanobacillus halotolerans]|uniref:cytochrome C n=1 Tax=Oceanobacillus halotolerans TaxID=2663380 RepID=UPI0013DBEF5E|nr:cytochrome C [Oceanobacillus halotolerans]